jgi:Fe-Mn family superoxide dismutase
MDDLIQDLPFDPDGLNGRSEALLLSHHRNNYAGAVKRLNAVRARLAALSPDSAAGFELAGLKREELLAGNSMLLHELYFDGLGGDGSDMAPVMALALAASFGSVARWRDEFMAMGRALGGGSGWVLLMFQPRDGRLLNQWAADHTQALAGGTPLLALDMDDHAYHLDFGADAAAYVEVFMGNIRWNAVFGRYRQAVRGASESLGANPDELAGAMLLDVRREATYQAAPTRLAGAHWRDPARVDDWAADLPREREIVLYCAHGHELSRATALRLRAAGLDVRFLRGGIEAAQAGLALETKEPSA